MKDKKVINTKDIVLSIFNNFNEIYGRTYIQKLLYIIEKESKLFKLDYNAYFYGPYSKELNEDMIELVQEELLKEDVKSLKNGVECYVYSLTKKGQKFFEEVSNKNISPELKNKIEEICNRFRSFTPTQLLKYVYQVYPKSAEKSIFF